MRTREGPRWDITVFSVFLGYLKLGSFSTIVQLKKTARAEEIAGYTALAAQFENWSSYPQNPSEMGQGVHSQSPCGARTGWLNRLESSRLKQKLHLSDKAESDWGRHQHQTMFSVFICTHTHTYTRKHMYVPMWKIKTERKKLVMVLKWECAFPFRKKKGKKGHQGGRERNKELNGNQSFNSWPWPSKDSSSRAVPSPLVNNASPCLLFVVRIT